MRIKSQNLRIVQTQSCIIIIPPSLYRSNKTWGPYVTCLKSDNCLTVRERIKFKTIFKNPDHLPAHYSFLNLMPLASEAAINQGLTFEDIRSLCYDIRPIRVSNTQMDEFGILRTRSLNCWIHFRTQGLQSTNTNNEANWTFVYCFESQAVPMMQKRLMFAVRIFTKFVIA